jgi:hypothetical protein
MSLDQALRRVGEVAANMQFDAELALVVAREVMPGLDEASLTRKTKELQIALLQRHLKITHAQLTAYNQGRARIQEKFSPTTHIDETSLVRAQSELSSKEAALEVAKAEFYTAFLSGREGTEADDAYAIAEAEVTAAKGAVGTAEQLLYIATRRLRSEQERLDVALRAFDEDNSIIAACTIYSERLLSEPARMEAAFTRFCGASLKH